MCKYLNCNIMIIEQIATYCTSDSISQWKRLVFSVVSQCHRPSPRSALAAN